MEGKTFLRKIGKHFWYNVGEIFFPHQILPYFWGKVLAGLVQKCTVCSYLDLWPWFKSYKLFNISKVKYFQFCCLRYYTWRCEHNPAGSHWRSFSPCCSCRIQLEIYKPPQSNFMKKLNPANVDIKSYLGIQGEIVEDHRADKCDLTRLKGK